MENALTQHVTVPTRETNVLDLILSTDPMVVSRVTASDNFRFLDKVSDHSAFICTINLSYVSPRPACINLRAILTSDVQILLP